MATLYLLCGFIGSGKTTYAKQLEQREQAIRFTLDEWMIPLFGEHMPRDEFDHALAVLTERFQVLAEDLLKQDVSVIFDFGFWKQHERESMRQWAAKLGAECRLIYLEQEFATCRERALSRNNQNDGSSYQMSIEMLELFWSWFEPPAPSEQAELTE